MFSSKSFTVSGLTFRSLIHLTFIFMYGVMECSNFILLHVAVQFSQHQLLKKLSFQHCVFLSPFSQVTIVHRFLWDSYPVHWSIFLFFCISLANTILSPLLQIMQYSLMSGSLIPPASPSATSGLLWLFEACFLIFPYKL